MKYIFYLQFRFFVWVFSLLPFSVIYKISDLIAFVLHKVIKYRAKIINQNVDLTANFLQFSDRDQLMRGIYRNLADISLEGIKGLSMKKETLYKRHKIINPELLDILVEQNQSVMIVTGHYNNWEWGAFSPNFFVQHKVIALYKPLTNHYIENFVKKRRSVYGSVLADINLTSQFYKDYHDQLALFLMAADQSPTKPELALWFEFLGVATPFVHGIEKYDERYDLPVVYVDIQRVDRGYYHITMDWIKGPNDVKLPKNYVTYSMVKKLEETIKKKPENWLWSHRRWKHIDKFPGQYDYISSQPRE